MAQLPILSGSELRGIAEVLGDTDGGLTNREIKELLAEAGIEDPTPKAAPGTYVAINKRDRLFNALATRQAHDKAPNAVLRCVEIAMAPIRYAGDDELFQARRAALNERLLHAGLELSEQGKLGSAAKATTVSEARDRTRRLRGKLEARGVHPRVLTACHAEIRSENYFHVVLEATKSLAEEIRQRGGISGDGSQLVSTAFDFKKGSLPRLAWNRLESATDRSEHRGLTNLCHGVVGAFRNPTAHEQKIQWEISEVEALDVCSMISLLHRRLESATAIDESVRLAAQAAS
ncbi:MAG: hypothetical protein JWM24_211 [Solirubrobacterales bacterium]|nr:hypothetical protein [Solirubrobacterales bacterium]